MIKNETQKNNTIESINYFKKELDNILNSSKYNDQTKNIYRNSCLTMIASLEKEVQEYENRGLSVEI